MQEEDKKNRIKNLLPLFILIDIVIILMALYIFRVQIFGGYRVAKVRAFLENQQELSYEKYQKQQNLESELDAVKEKMDELDKPIEEIHYHAGFQVYLDDELVDFAEWKYMTINPCGEDHDHDYTEAELAEYEQKEKAHLHDKVGDVVHVHAAGAIWKDVFINAEYEFGDYELTGYVNGEEVEDILSHPINEYDSVVIIGGEVTNLEEKLTGAVEIEHIQEAESASENCGS